VAITDELFYHTQMYNEKFKKICYPLKTIFGATEISLHFVDNLSLINLHTHKKWMEYCMEKRYFLTDPHITSPQKIKLGFTVDAYHPDEAFVNGLLGDSHMFNMHHGVAYTRKTPAGYQAISLAASIENMSMPNKIINNSEIILRFMDYLEKEMQPIQKKLADRVIDLIKIKDKSKLDGEDDSINVNAKEQQKAIEFFKQIGVINSNFTNISLSEKEKTCLKLCLEGKTAEDAANILYLSRRTIEGHMERIKEKLNCQRKKDLMSKRDVLKCIGALD
jgi:DNA-binding CsgD family transcriptional regulator